MAQAFSDGRESALRAARLDQDAADAGQVVQRAAQVLRQRRRGVLVALAFQQVQDGQVLVAMLAIAAAVCMERTNRRRARFTRLMVSMKGIAGPPPAIRGNARRVRAVDRPCRWRCRHPAGAVPPRGGCQHAFLDAERGLQQRRRLQRQARPFRIAAGCRASSSWTRIPSRSRAGGAPSLPARRGRAGPAFERGSARSARAAALRYVHGQFAAQQVVSQRNGIA